MANQTVTKRHVIKWIFVIYVLALLFMLVIPNNYRRQNVFVGGLTFDTWLAFISNSFNIVPFRSIFEQIGTILAGQAVLRQLVYLIGNIVGFMPLGYFLPTLFAKQSKFHRFITTVLMAVLVLELLQVLTMRGSFDIDDLILNTMGACIGYWLARKIPPLNHELEW